MQEKLQELLRIQAEAIRLIPSEQIEEAIHLIHQYVHEKDGKVVVSGMGKAGNVGHNLAKTLSATGTPALFLHPGEAQHGDLGILQKNDILLLISNSGKTREILELQRLAHQLYPTLPIIALTSSKQSPLAQLADIVLLTGNPPEICPHDLTPTTSIIAMSAVGNLLVVCLMEKLDFSRHDFAKRHHGGYLGSKAKNE